MKYRLNPVFIVLYCSGKLWVEQTSKWDGSIFYLKDGKLFVVENENLFASDNFFRKNENASYLKKRNETLQNFAKKSQISQKILAVSEKTLLYICVLFLASLVYFSGLYVCSLMMIICLGLGFCMISSCGSIFESLCLSDLDRLLPVYADRSVSPTFLWKTHKWFLCKANSLHEWKVLDHKI